MARLNRFRYVQPTFFLGNMFRSARRDPRQFQPLMLSAGFHPSQLQPGECNVFEGDSGHQSLCCKNFLGHYQCSAILTTGGHGGGPVAISPRVRRMRYRRWY